MQILIIEDDSAIRSMLRRMFEQEGYDVADASNGKEGLKLFRKDPAKLVITDLIMPEKEGIETIIALRRDFPDLKIIAISGGGIIGPKDYLEIAKTLGADFTFTKPLELKELLEAVKELLEQK